MRQGLSVEDIVLKLHKNKPFEDFPKDIDLCTGFRLMLLKKKNNYVDRSDQALLQNSLLLVNANTHIILLVLLALHCKMIRYAFPNDGIFSGAYDDEDVGAEANFNNYGITSLLILEANPLLILIILKTFECLWLHTLHAKPESFSGQCLSEYISQLILCPHEIQLNNSLLHLFSDEMMSDADVFRPGVLDVVAA
ncbi:hypothetical protein Tco_0532896 [Tanacetum coccineum]